MFLHVGFLHIVFRHIGLRYIGLLVMVMLAGQSQAEVLIWRSSHTINSPSDIALSPDGSQAYVANLQGNAIEVLSRNADTGALSVIETKVIETTSGEAGLVYPWRVQTSSDGQFVYVITQGSLRLSAPEPDSLLVFKRGGDGKLSFVETLQNGSGGIAAMSLPSDLALSYSGDQLYVRAAGSNSLLVFSRDIATGKLALLQTLRDSDAGVDGLNGEGWLAASADGNFVYATSVADNSVTLFARDAITNQLALVKIYKNAVDGVSGLSGAWGVALSPDDKHLYVAGSGDGAIVAFARDEVSGELSFETAYLQGELNQTGDATRSFDGLNGPIAVTVSPDGQRVYVSGQEQGSPDSVSTLAVMRRDPADGSLSFMEVHRSSNAASIAGLNGVVRYALSPDGQFLYSAGLEDDNIGVFGHLQADLSLVVLDDADPVNLGESFNYIITVTNNSEDVAGGAAVSAVLPSEVGFVSVDSASCEYAAGMVKCELGDMAGGVFTQIQVQVSAPLGEMDINAHAVAFSEYNDANPADNQDQEATTVANLTPNVPPIAVDDVAYSLPGKSLVMNLLDNDQDEDGDSLTIVSVDKETVATQGTLTINGDTQVTYTPPAKQNGKEYTGSESFVYRIMDVNGAEDEGLVTIVVNTSPVASNDTAKVTQGQSVTVLVLVNDTDPDGDTIQIASVDASMLTDGSVQMNDDGTITYTASESTGDKTIVYTIQDSNAATAQAQVTVQVQAAAGSGGDNAPPETTAKKNGGGGAIDLASMLLLLTLVASTAARTTRAKNIRT